MKILDSLKIKNNIYIDWQSNGILTAFCENEKKPFFVIDLQKNKVLFGNNKKSKKIISVFNWLTDFFTGKKEVIYSNGSGLRVRGGKFEFFKVI